jgi:hypothetical protein
LYNCLLIFYSDSLRNKYTYNCMKFNALIYRTPLKGEAEFLKYIYESLIEFLCSKKIYIKKMPQILWQNF